MEYHSGAIYVMDHEVVACHMAFFSWTHFMVKIPWSYFYKTHFLKYLWTLTRCNPTVDYKNDYAPKSGCASFFNICKENNFEIYFLCV